MERRDGFTAWRGGRRVWKRDRAGEDGRSARMQTGRRPGLRNRQHFAVRPDAARLSADLPPIKIAVGMDNKGKIY